MKVLAIVGPTAVGKSSLAVAIAKHCRGEIISTDSMQIYIGMNIGTATPTETERDGVPHHIVDVWTPSHDVSVAEFQQVARSAIDEVISRGAQPIVVGGSGLYVAGGNGGFLFTSTDGITWTQAANNPFLDIGGGKGYGVACNGARCVAVGEGLVNTIAYSDDGITWTGLGKNVFTTRGNGVAWNGTRWVAVGTGSNEIAY